MGKSIAFGWYGGKFSHLDWLLPLLPKTKHFCEPFGGSAAVLLNREPSPVETYNDIDGEVVNFFRVLRDRPNELIRKIRLTPWARAEFEISRGPSGDDIEDARRFFFSSNASIGAMPFDTSTGMRTIKHINDSYSAACHNFYELPDVVAKVADRLIGVQIEQRDYIYIITRYDTPDTLIFFDPPYIKNNRSNTNVYAFEWSDEQHKEAADLLKKR